MNSFKKIYLSFSSLMFVIAIFLSSASAEATCYTCRSNDPGGCPTTTDCGMTACDLNQDCFIFGALCGTGCFLDE